MDHSEKHLFIMLHMPNNLLTIWLYVGKMS